MIRVLPATFITNRPPWVQAVDSGLRVGLFTAVAEADQQGGQARIAVEPNQLDYQIGRRQSW